MSDQSNEYAAGGDQPRLLPIRKVAEMLGVSRITISRAIAAGEMPCVQVRSKRQVPRVFVESLLSTAESGESVVVEEYAANWRAR